MKDTIETDQAAKPRGAYSQAVVSGDTMYLAGQIGLRGGNPDLADTLEEQTRQVLANIRGILADRGLDFGNLLTMTCYLSEGQEWSIFDKVYGECLGDYARPARTTVIVKGLPLGALVEITAVAHLA
ncbi:MAG: RidA family protein [Novosphingobium sp.]